MQTLFEQQLAKHCPNQTAFLIGLSGGVDSVVLLHLFAHTRQRRSLTLRAIHIHHGLSPNANSWVQFCEQLCEQWQIPLSVCRVQVQGKQGLEADARKARYQAIQAHIQPNEWLATAHHLDDQVETFFLALKRGSGIKGLGAMQAVSSWQNFTIFRPLLSFNKGDILRYAEQHQLHWIEDESNLNTDFDRNFLRQSVLPQLNQRWSQFSQMVARSSQHCTEQQQLIEELLQTELANRLENGKLNIHGFAHFSPLKQQQLVRMWLATAQVPMPTVAQLEQIIHHLILAKADKNPQVTLEQQTIRRYQQQLWITPNQTDIADFELELCSQTDEIHLPEPLGTVRRIHNEIIYKLSGKSYRFPLPESLADTPLRLTNRYPSKVQCYGKTQREDMKKIWQENQVPVWQRGNVPLVFFNQTLVTMIKI
ncbi:MULTISPECIES: tRNA lysidine(34) synthetase TilS [Glaesserella]|uniref:tRNA(Ile)-lysidine synthase n=1 Tax=Glaesserella australis TaxID=2094024 RepID=A0A328C4S9_9PAST|nr:MULTISPECIES: tRNA lysidine(34) synthetase TilS [Glaesserella]AUI66902.1 tRNA lysidine(34) synthetase TilS [Glaesserella sp. 15-184]RAL19534.1 tRNA lysidine(34) synthetase TilS [Glaesserella australis]